jgi:Tol biopolymer transport system component
MRRAWPALLLLALAGCGSQHGTIAFTSTRDGDAEVYAMRADGGDVRNLTRNLAQDGQPAWSPDGKSIAFVSTRDGNAGIYVMKADGSGQRRLTHSAANDTAPVWSPDGTKIAFMCTVASPRLVTEICVVDDDGRDLRELTQPSQGDNLYPEWSSDSEIILCTRSYGGYSVWSLRADGGGQSLFLARSAAAAYSPDGSRLASLNRRPQGGWALYVGRQRVSNADRSVDSLAWSPKGDRLAYVAGGDIYVVKPDGTGGRRLTHGPGNSLSPQWSPDGKSIVFERLRGRHSDVYVVGADGSGLRPLTRAAGKNGGPVWQP